MKRHLLLYACTLAVLAGLNAAGSDVPQRQSGSRHALLIGVDDYGEFQLPGMSASLDRLQPALESAGFSVVSLRNADRKATIDALETFGTELPTNSVALLYFYGVSASLERQGKMYNLLRPARAEIPRENEYRSRALRLEDLVGDLERQSGCRTLLVFIDAAWHSPLLPKGKMLRRGLREIQLGADSLAVYAGELGSTLPPPEKNLASPLSTSLAKHIASFDHSVSRSCAAISKDLSGAAWVKGAGDLGLGDAPKGSPLREVRLPKQAGASFVNSVGMTFRWCPPGEFSMGGASRDGADSHAVDDRRPVRAVISEGFWLGECEVTQREYLKVVKRKPNRGFTEHKNAPFWGVTDAKSVEKFLNGLTKLDETAGSIQKDWQYVIPTEAEWEYACRAGSTTRYCFGEETARLSQYGNFADRSLRAADPNCFWATETLDDGFGSELAPVGSFLPNAWGFRDMHGNVAEIVADHWTPELPGGRDPLVRVKKDGVQAIRGGSWCSLPEYCESSFRNALHGRDKRKFVGFRIALKRISKKAKK
ncbi:MAG: SUMF1/EgtB/PvdO family nonheme iron enzyme [Planctomycetota bacterium]